jgi:hypothetical protein
MICWGLTHNLRIFQAKLLRLKIHKLMSQKFRTKKINRKNNLIIE